MIKTDIETAISDVLATLGAGEVTFTVEQPADMVHGDYATNAALAAAKVLKKNPKDVAESLAKELEGKVAGVKKIEVAGVGFINFTISGMTIKDIVHEAQEAKWGSNELYKNKKVMVEYTDPNPFKEFHIGHLMSNAIGEAIARLLEAAGAQVTRANYQGDVGLHVAKEIRGMQIMIDKFPSEDSSSGEKAYFLGTCYQVGSKSYDSDPGFKQQVDDLNKIIYEHSDSEINKLYDWGRKVSLEHFEELYKILGTKFDKYFFESESWPIGLELVKKNIGKVFEESEGAVVYKGEQDGLHTRVFLTKAGLTTYEAKDLGLLKLKEETGDFDTSITVTANEQKEYFKVVLAAAKKIDEVKDIANKTMHVTHGMMRFANGKMSSRTGNVITGESLLSDLQEDAKAKMEGRSLPDADKVAEQIAVSAVKYTVLKSGSGKDIVFDPEKSLSLEGDSGPYVQYALVRARSLLRKAADAEVVQPEPSGPTPFERLIIHFPEVVAHAAVELEPHYVVTYITELAAAFNSWYASERFIVDGKITSRTVAVLKAVENTLAQGLKVLGIPAPQEM
ncbi:MAG TPA: arginine--tRNA ligase [Candidatus Paceibacterota bacterium]|nr:arginine--tRNA ligase [Candidatus Paceibacterota bacterium]